MTGSGSINLFMPELLPNDSLPLMVQAAGEDKDQKELTRTNGYPAYHIMLSISGTGRLETSTTHIDVPSGYMFMLAPDQPHHYYPLTTNWHTCWIVFYGADARQIISRLRLIMGQPFLFPKIDDFLRIYQNICNCTLESSLNGIYSASAFCYNLLTMLSIETSNHEGCSPSRISKSRIAPALNFIQDQYAKDIGLTQIANYIGISPQHLCKLFQMTIAMTPREYLMQYRLKKAKELLMNISLPIKKVGFMCGFQDPSYFCRVFKSQVGFTPKEFRELFYSE